MENYMIIDEVDVAFVQQNSWIVLLEKQLQRNWYLFRTYQPEHKNKPNPKLLFPKLKAAINKHITTKIKTKKLIDKLSPKLTPSHSLSLRTKTQQTLLSSSFNLLAKSKSITKTPKISLCPHMIQSPSVYKSPERQKNASVHFLPCRKSSPKTKESNALKRMIRKSVEYQLTMPKTLSQAKPILSLHELEFNKKQLLSSESSPLKKLLTHIETLLVHSPNSSTKRHIQVQVQTFDRKMSDILPTLSSPSKVCMKDILSHIRSAEGLSRDEFIDFGKIFESLSKTKMRKSIKNTQQTKESESQNGFGLESIVEEGKPGDEKIESQSRDLGIQKNMGKKYRISRVRNIKFPIL